MTAISQTYQATPACPAEAGAAADGVRLLLRLEGTAAFGVAVALYAHAGFSWVGFVIFFLAPDISMLAYLGGPRVGAVGYNLFHTEVLALAAAAIGFLAGLPLLTAGGLVWIAHIGLDRALGYGLKYPDAFGHTHLSRIGRG
jgi:hypothetical protein